MPTRLGWNPEQAAHGISNLPLDPRGSARRITDGTGVAAAAIGRRGPLGGARVRERLRPQRRCERRRPAILPTRTPQDHPKNDPVCSNATSPMVLVVRFCTTRPHGRTLGESQRFRPPLRQLGAPSPTRGRSGGGLPTRVTTIFRNPLPAMARSSFPSACFLDDLHSRPPGRQRAPGYAR